MRRLWHIANCLAALGVAACGNTKVAVSALPQFRYYVESKFTGQVENNLIVEGTGTELLTFKLSGHGFSADVPLDVEAPVRPKTKLQYVEVGDYAANIQFFKTDGTPLLQDSLKWTFSLDAPDNPIAGFASAATNDSHVVLFVSESRDARTNEIWLEGDLAPEDKPAGSWRPIPKTSTIPLVLSAADGNKVVKFKLRNDFKNETELKNLQILKKTVAPTNCRYEVKGAGTATRFFDLVVAAENDGPLYYRVFGDVVEPNGFQMWSGPSTRLSVKLTEGAGIKKVTLQIRDAAENFCLREDIKMTYDPAYITEGIRIKDNRTWTDYEQVIVQPWIDHFSDDVIEVYVHGDIATDTGTFRWIPWTPELLVTLQPVDGNRWVRIQFRVNGQLSSFRYVPIYLKPNVIILPGTSTPNRIVASNMINLSSLTITGCAEAYSQVSFAASYDCTPTAALASIQYVLKDGSTLTKTAAFSP